MILQAIRYFPSQPFAAILTQKIFAADKTVVFAIVCHQHDRVSFSYFPPFPYQILKNNPKEKIVFNYILSWIKFKYFAYTGREQGLVELNWPNKYWKVPYHTLQFL